MKYEWFLLLMIFFLPLKLSAQDALVDTMGNEGITLVSDTVDDVSGNNADSLDDWSDDKQDLGEGIETLKGLFDSNDNFLLSLLSIPFILLVVVILLFVFLPIILFIVLLWLLFRKNKRSTAQNFVEKESEQSVSIVEKPKDRSVRHISIGIGLIVFCLIMGWKFGTAAGALLMIYGIGEYYIARKHDE